EKLRLRFDSSAARKRCRRQRPEGRGAARRVILPPPPSLHVAHSQITSLMPHILPMPGRMRSNFSPDALRLSGLPVRTSNKRSASGCQNHYTGGKRRLTGELFTIEVLHCAYSAKPSSNVSSCSMERTTSRITKQSSPVTLSLSIHSGIA
ncbi:hypothetical protein SAMN03159434_12428, partial [Enterobacter sp. NFR05]